jgi:hypothetical protein
VWGRRNMLIFNGKLGLAFNCNWKMYGFGVSEDISASLGKLFPFEKYKALQQEVEISNFVVKAVTRDIA